jgi:hypothetical protein
VQGWITLAWALHNLAVLCTFLKFGREEFQKYSGKKYYCHWIVLIFAMALNVQIYFKAESSTAGLFMPLSCKTCLCQRFIFICCAKENPQKGRPWLLHMPNASARYAQRATAAGWQLAAVFGIFCFIFDAIYIIKLHSCMKISN